MKEYPESWKSLPLVEINDWLPLSINNEGSFRLCGMAKNHPSCSGEHVAVTSVIQETYSFYVRTKRSVYKLGTPNEDWLQSLEKENKNFDPENPTKPRVLEC